MNVYDVVRDDTASNQFRGGEQDWPQPVIEPGQIWLVECDPASLSAFHGVLLTRANVVLYEATLGAAVAEELPIGAYAEKLRATAAAAATIAPRALQFAADGWSVLQL